MAETLGEKLRRAREERGISISEVAEQTRIASLYLSSIENDDYKPLPGGIFNKGFVKSYARYIGYDEQEALHEYSNLVASHEAEEPDAVRGYRPEVLTDDRTSGSMWPTLLFAGLILGLMTAGILFAVNYIQNRGAPQPVTTGNTNVNTAANSEILANTAEPPKQVVQTPPLAGSRVEFRAVSEPIWLRSIVDGGKSSETIVQPDAPAVFEAKESLTLRYSKSLAQAASLTINGKSITLPTEPANPKLATIELDINKNNFGEIWRTGQFALVTADPRPVAGTTSVPNARTPNAGQGANTTRLSPN
ncbi:MAG: helix-turn-helix domain-containing protein [Acidobacteriota bacterium]